MTKKPERGPGGARYVALIRGINVGRAKRIAMADLRALVEDLGYSNVRTLLNSGNIVFAASPKTAPGAASRIERAIAERLKVSARVIVLSAAQLAEVISANPFLSTAHTPSRVLVTVLGDRSQRARLDAVAAEAWAPEAFAVGGHAAYLWCPNGFLASPLAVAVGRALGDGATSRNWSTMMKLHDLAARD